MDLLNVASADKLTFNLQNIDQRAAWAWTCDSDMEGWFSPQRCLYIPPVPSSDQWTDSNIPPPMDYWRTTDVVLHRAQNGQYEICATDHHEHTSAPDAVPQELEPCLMDWDNPEPFLGNSRNCHNCITSLMLPRSSPDTLPQLMVTDASPQNLSTFAVPQIILSPPDNDLAGLDCPPKAPGTHATAV